VHLDRGEALEVALEALERLRLGLGDPLPPNERHHLLEADADVRVREAALSLLSYRARTRTELRRKLTGKGFRPARVDVCLDRLEERGLVDDSAVAATFVRDRLRHRPRGKARLTSELRAKGLGGPLSGEVVDAVLADEGVSERGLAVRVAEGWLRRQGTATVEALAASTRTAESEKTRRRLYGHLARRGFRGEDLRSGIDAAVALARSPAVP
jgi:regulatory protein